MSLDVLKRALPLLLAGLAAAQPAPPDSGRAVTPRILLSEDVEAGARAAGFDPRLHRPGVYGVGMDSGEIFSLAAPESIGGGKVRILRMEAGGALRADTLSAERVVWIETPGNPHQLDLPLALALTGLLPVLLTGGNPFVGVLGLTTASMLSWSPPQFTRYPRRDFFRPGPYLRGAVAFTLEGVARDAFDADDQRQEAVPVWNLQAEAGSPLSCLSFSLSARLAQVNHRWTTEPLPFPPSYGFDPAMDDSLYAMAGMGLALSPAVKVALLETRRVGFYTQLGGYGAWLPGTSLPASTGFSLGAGLDLWLTEALGLRTTASLLLPVTRYDGFKESPSVGAGVAYRWSPRPPPTHSPALFVSLMDMLPAPRLAPDVGLEVEQDLYQTMGFRVWEVGENRFQSVAYDSVTSSESQIHSNHLGCEVQYGWHSDRGERLYGGILISAGVVAMHRQENDRHRSPTYPAASTQLENRSDFSFSAGLEAGVRLAAGFGLRAQARPLRTPFPYEGAEPPFSFGLTYRIPGHGERR